MRSTFRLLLPALPAAIALFLTGCITSDSAYTRAAPGIWRGVLTLEAPVYAVAKKDSVSLLSEQFQPGQLPFNFEVKYIDNERFVVEFINGDERIVCDSIRWGRDRTTARDTINIYFPEYQTYLHADIRGNAMQGYFINPLKADSKVPFIADSGKGHRFTTLLEPPVADLSGEWATLLGVNEDNPERAIGEFKQNGNHLTGTFRTETGDYRFLEGTVQGRKFWLSCFDGVHLYLFSGSVQGDSLQGEFRSGKRPPVLWTSWRDPKFQLGNPDSLTTARAGVGVNFNLKTPDGRDLTYPSPAFDGKVKIFTVMGTWCPNCRDEQNFLRDFLAEHPDLAKQITVVGFSFERKQDPAQANAHLLDYKKKMRLPFEVVLAGEANKDEAAKFFPALSQVMAFPTMLILDKKGQIRRVHTGFDGPATSKYADFKQHFTSLMGELVQEM